MNELNQFSTNLVISESAVEWSRSVAGKEFFFVRKSTHVKDLRRETFSQASGQNYCRSLGGSLPKVESKEEQDFVHSIAFGSSIWLGATRQPDSCNASFCWLDGTPLIYTDWSPAEKPDASDGVALLSNNKWVGRANYNEMRLVCQRDGYNLLFQKFARQEKLFKNMSESFSRKLIGLDSKLAAIMRQLQARNKFYNEEISTGSSIMT